MENLRINISKTGISPDAVKGYEKQAADHLAALYNKTGKGSDFLGWVELPSQITDAQFSDLEATAAS